MNFLPPGIKNEELLSYVRPLYPNGVFPLAPGWQIVIAAVVCLGAAGYLFHNRLRARRRRKAFSVLDSLRSSFAQDRDVSALASGVSVLLKRSALVCFRDEETAGLQGAQWTAFLIRTGAELDDGEKTLLEKQAYAPACPDGLMYEQGERLIETAKKWMELNL